MPIIANMFCFSVWISVVLLFMSACHKQTTSETISDSESKDASATASEVAYIAKAEVINREGWVDKVEIGSIVQFNDGWRVEVWRLPKVPGGMRIVVISTDKKVKNYLKGK